MRPKIHGWIVSLLVSGAGGLLVGAYAVHDVRHAEETKAQPPAAEPSAPVVAYKPPPKTLPHLEPVPTGTESSEPDTATARAKPKGPSAAERFQALVNESKAADASGPSGAKDGSRPSATIRLRSEGELEPITLASYDPADPAQTATQDPRLKNRPDQKPASQFTRPVSNINASGLPLTQDGQVPSNIGQVDVQALEQLGVVILKGSPQDVEAMKKIIEEIQRISEGVEPFVRVFQLEHASASQVRDTIQELYPGGTSSTGSTAPRTTTTPQGGAQPGGASATSVIQTPALKRFQLAVNERSNTLIVLASPQMMEELSRLILRLDVDGAPIVNEVRVFPLKNAEAQEITNVLVQAITSQSASASGATTAAPTQGGATGATVAGGGEVKIGNKNAVIKFIPSEGGGRAIDSGILDYVRVTAQVRTNSVIVSAPTSAMGLMQAIINELDRPPTIVASMKVFELKNADATNMRITLQELFDLEPTTTTGGAGGGLNNTNTLFQRPVAVAEGAAPPVSIRVAVDERTNALIVSGPENALDSVGAVIRRLDVSDIFNRKSMVYRLKNSQAADVAAALTQFFTSKRTIEGAAAGGTAASGTIVGQYQRLEQEVVVVALDNALAASLTTALNTNSPIAANQSTQGVSNLLLVSATARRYDEAIKLIEQLDAAQPQVMIQVTIAQVTLNDDFEFGIELGLQNTVLFQRGNTSVAPPGTTAGITPVNPGVPGFPFNNTPLPPLGNSSDIGSGQVGNQGVSNFALGRLTNIDGLGNVAGLVLTASSRNVNAMLRALQANTKVEIISRPQLMTIDGRTSRIQVGESFPYVSQVELSATSGFASPTVSFLPIGVTLTVKPSITPDDRIYLEVVPEITELIERVTIATVGNIPQIAPRTSITAANTVISVNDGQTIVLGGLIQKRNTDFVRKVPWLGDIPYLGCLFRYTQELEKRQELLIILTPHIVRSEADAQRIKDMEVARVHCLMQDAAEIHGDLGLSQNQPNIAPVPMMDSEGAVIQQMSGEVAAPATTVPNDWAIPEKQPAKKEQDSRSLFDRLRHGRGKTQ
jgi:general secretion pathway protein D